MKQLLKNWRGRRIILSVIMWLWLLLAVLTLFPTPLLWLAGGVGVALIGTTVLIAQRLRHYVWFLPCLPLILAWYVPIPLSPSLPPFPRLGITMGIWTALLILLLGTAAYLSQRENPPAAAQPNRGRPR